MLFFGKHISEQQYKQIYELIANNNDVPKEYSFLKRCIFIVEDKDSLIKNLENKGYTVKGGPQKGRHLSSEIGGEYKNSY